MANQYVVVKLKGETDYWLVDFDNKSVSPMPNIAVNPFGYTDDASLHGAVLTAGIDVAVATVSRDDAFAGKLDT